MSSVIQELRRKLPFKVKDGEIHQESAQINTVSANVIQIAVEDIIPNRSQPRSAFNQNAILRLADSIRRYGILQPLTVRKILVPSKPYETTTDAESTYLPPNYIQPAPTLLSHQVLYELVAGERRLRAAKIAEFATVPCIVMNTDDATSAELAIVENILREDLNMFEQAEAFRRLIDEFMLTQEEVARRVSLSQSAVANKLRILRLSHEERKRILESGLTERHARALLKIPDTDQRSTVLTYIIDNKWNVSNTETYIDRILDEMAQKKREAQSNAPIPTASAAIHTGARPGDTVQNEFSNASALFRKKGAIRDIRLFYNSVRNAATILEQTGATVKIDQQESEESIVITLVIHPAAIEKPI